jgi:hypothetical protein
MEIEDLLIETLESFGYPVRLQGSLLEDEPYPDNFFTFWNNNSTSQAFYDNDENAIVYSYSVNFYSIEPNKCYEMVRNAKKELKKKGFILTGDGYSVTSDEPTHDGRGISAEYLKIIERK